MKAKSTPAHRLVPSRRGILLAAGATLAAILVGGAPSPARADDPSAAALAFLQSIYAPYQNGGAGIDRTENGILATLFTPELAAMIADDDARAAADGEVPNLEADPFIDAQDGEIGPIDVTIADAPGGRYVGRASFTNSGEPKVIELVLVETPAGWRIDDIHWPEGTLRGLYSH